MLTVEQVNKMVESGKISASVGMTMIAEITEHDHQAVSPTEPATIMAFQDASISIDDVVINQEVCDHADRACDFSGQSDTADLGVSVNIAGMLWGSKIINLDDKDDWKTAVLKICTKAIPVSDKEENTSGKMVDPYKKTTGLIKLAGLQKTASFDARLGRYINALHELKKVGGIEAVNECFVKASFEDQDVTTLLPAGEIESKVKKIRKAGKTPETMEEAFARVGKTTKNMAETHITNYTTAVDFKARLEKLHADQVAQMEKQYDEYVTKAGKARKTKKVA